MLEINRLIRIPLSEFHWTFVRCGGPGGQNVNKVASKAVLRWNIQTSPSLTASVKARLQARNRNRITAAGELLIWSQTYRDQERNRADCLRKLQEMIRQAATPPKERKRTKPTKASRQRRLDTKRQRGLLKQSRRAPIGE
jgi:ribosome-associated protein